MSNLFQLPPRPSVPLEGEEGLLHRLHVELGGGGDGLQGLGEGAPGIQPAHQVIRVV